LLTFLCLNLFAAAGTEQVAIQGTILDYTVILTNGQKDIPVGSTLDVTATPVSISAVTCTTGAEVPLPLAAATTAPLAAGAVITCKFSVTVDSNHKTAAVVPAITVTATFGAAAADMVYTVPAAEAAAVPVFDGTPTIHKVAAAVGSPSKTGAATKRTN
jgi:hypothetical protein